VRDVLRPFDRKDEILRRLLIPLLKTARPLQRVEGAVDLDEVQLSRSEGKLIRLPQLFGIKCAAPRLVPPARNADPQFA